MSEGSRQNRKRGVRFTPEAVANGNERRAPPRPPDDDDDDEEEEPPRKRHKRPRQNRPNEDEMDDVDDFVPDDEDDIPSESQTLRAKRERRLKQAHDDDEEEEGGDSTHIDNDTSLAAEGIAVEPFHMNQESSDGTGYFDGDTYVFRKRDAGEEPDAWLESIEGKEDEMIEASSAKASARKPSNNDSDDDDNNNNEDEGNDTSGSKMDTWTREELYAQIIPFVSDSESVMQAIARYGSLIKRHGREASETALAKKALNDLTEASSALMMRGEHDIYQKTRHDLSQILTVQEVPDRSGTAPTRTDEKPAVQWEYQGSQDGQVHGPFTTQQMQGWIGQGYFVGTSAVMIRTICHEAPKPEMKDDLLSDLLDDDDDDNDDSGGGQERPPTEAVKGEWVKSDQVDFSKFS